MDISNILKYVKDKILIQILIAIIFCIFSYNHLSDTTISNFYSISLTLRSILAFILPFLIISAISTSFAKIPKGGFGFAIFVLLMICLSNFINMMISYCFGSAIINSHSSTIDINHQILRKIEPSFIFHFPKFEIFNYSFDMNPSLISNGSALVFGLIVGISCSLFQLKKIENVVNSMNKIMMFFMSKIFVRFLPLFIAGFLLKLFAEGELFSLIKSQLFNSIAMIGLLITYLIIWFLIASWFNFERLKEIFRNIAPAMLTAFSTMSSAAALPLSLEAAEKNTKDKVLSNSIIPISMNLHMLGDTICIPIMALIIISGFGAHTPTFLEFATFGLFFVLNKFAGAGIPGGTIMVSLPILQKTLGFTPEMIGLITAIYIVFDPIATTGNVTANGIFVIFIQKILKFFKKEEIKSNEEIPT
jgi:Na+/H+-dicarboxylate symporter